MSRLLVLSCCLLIPLNIVDKTRGEIVAHHESSSRVLRALPADPNDETSALQRVADLMAVARSRNITISTLEPPHDSSNDNETPEPQTFAVLPARATDYDQLYIKIQRNPLSYMWKRLHLEDFWDLARVPPQPALADLRVNTSLLATAAERAADFYGRVVANLIAALPNLRIIRLGGGYRFDAIAINGTLNDMIDDLANLRANLVAAIRALHSRGLQVELPKYRVELQFPQAVVDEFGHDTLVDALRGVFAPIEAEWTRQRADIVVDTDDVRTAITIVVGSPFPRRRPPTTICSGDVKTDESGNHVCSSFKSPFALHHASLSLEDTLYLEDFARLADIEPRDGLVALNLSVSIAPSDRRSHMQLYETAIASLRRAAPRLLSLGLFGTLRYYPRISNLYELRVELTEIKRSLDAMSRVVGRNFDRVRWYEPPVFVFAIDREMLKRVQGGDIVKSLDIFNYQELELVDGRVSVVFDADERLRTEIVIVLSAFYGPGHTPL